MIVEVIKKQMDTAALLMTQHSTSGVFTIAIVNLTKPLDPIADMQEIQRTEEHFQTVS